MTDGARVLHICIAQIEVDHCAARYACEHVHHAVGGKICHSIRYDSRDWRKHDDIVKALEPAWQSANATSERLKNQLRALEAKLEEARRKRGTLLARQRAAEARDQLDQTLSRFEDGFAAHQQFSRMEDKVADMEARSAALDELDNLSSPLEKEFLDLEVRQEVDAELEKLKTKLRQE